MKILCQWFEIQWLGKSNLLTAEKEWLNAIVGSDWPVNRVKVANQIQTWFLNFDQKVTTGEMMSIVWFLALDEHKVSYFLFNYGLFFQLWIFLNLLKSSLF